MDNWLIAFMSMGLWPVILIRDNNIRGCAFRLRISFRISDFSSLLLLRIVQVCYRRSDWAFWLVAIA